MAKSKTTLTNLDIDLLVNRMTLIFPTRKEFEEIEKKQDKKYNEVINKLDAVMGELQNKRQVQEIHGKQHQDVNDKLDEHDKRIEKLEAN